MTAILRVACVIFLVLSLTVGCGLIAWDLAHGFTPLQLHQRAVAAALILVGASYAMAHMQGTVSTGSRVRAISLGIAFVLWGVEQFMSPGRLAVATDCVLVAIFVIDLSLAVKK